MKLVLCLFLVACGEVPSTFCKGEGVVWMAQGNMCLRDDSTDGLPMIPEDYQSIVDVASATFRSHYPEVSEESLWERISSRNIQVLLKDDVDGFAGSTFPSLSGRIYIRVKKFECAPNTALGHELMHAFAMEMDLNYEHNNSELFLFAGGTCGEWIESAENEINRDLCTSTCGTCNWAVIATCLSQPNCFTTEPDDADTDGGSYCLEPR